MADWKKIVLATGTSSEYIKGDGTFATDTDSLPLTGGTVTGDVVIKNNNGNASQTLLILRNNDNTSNTETDQTAELEFQFKGTTDSGVSFNTKNAGKIVAGKDTDYFTASADNMDSHLKFYTSQDNVNTLALTIDSNQDAIFGADVILSKATNSAIYQDDSSEFLRLGVGGSSNDIPRIEIYGKDYGGANAGGNIYIVSGGDGDATSGDILLGADQGAFVEHMRITNSGNISLNGVTTVTTDTSPALLVNDANGDTQFQVNVNASDGAEITVSDGGSTERVRFSARSSGYSYITNAGTCRLGIGTSSPSELLHLESAEPVLRFTDSDDSKYHHIFASSDDLYISADRGTAGTGGNIIFRVGSTSEKMRIDGSGRVGIGKTSLSKTLHVDSNIGSAGTPNGIMMTNTIDGSNSKIYMYANNDAGATKNASITLDPDAETMSIDYNGNALTIGSTGNVNINNSSSTAILTVKSTAAAEDARVIIDRDDNNGRAYLKFADTDNTYNWFTGLLRSSGNNYAIGTGDDFGTNTHLSISSSGNTTLNGNLSLATTSPVVYMSGSSGDHTRFGWTEGDPDVAYWRFYQNSGLTASITMDAFTENTAGGRIEFNSGSSEVAIASIDSSGVFLGKTASGQNTTTKLGGYGVLHPNGTRYGKYGWLTFNPPTNSYTGGARGWAITNGYQANKFALLQSTNANDEPVLTTSGETGTSTTAPFVIDNSGNVGIGVSPTGKLDINISSDARAYFSSNIGEVGSGNFALQAVDSSGANLKPLGFRADDIRFATGSAERMRLIDTGLGIGTTSPTEKLTIFGGVASPATSGTGANGNLAIESSNGNSLYIGSYYASPYGVWLQASNYADQSLTYPIILNPRGGNVGIGTTNPLAKLVVSDGGNAGIELQPEISADTNRITNYDRTANAYMDFKLDALSHNIQTSGSSAIYIDSNGKVGIGTEVGSAYYSDELVVEVVDNGGITIANTDTGHSAYIMFADGTSGDSVYRCQLGYDHNIDRFGIWTGATNALLIDSSQRLTTQNSITISHATPEIVFAVPSGGLDSRIHNDGSGNLIFGHGTNSSAPTEAMRIDSSQRVGIGSTDPGTFKLHVSGSTDILHLEGNGAGGPQLRLQDSSSTTNGDNFGYIDFSANDSIDGAIIMNRISNVVVDNTTGSTDSRLTISNRVNGTLTEVLSVASGKVGIGTSSPSTLLHVEKAIDSDWIAKFKNTGTTNAYGVQIDTTANTTVGELSLAVYTGTGTGMFVTSEGKTGIGTTAPDSQFHLHGSTGMRLTDSNQNANEYAEIKYDNAGSTNLYINNDWTNSNALINFQLAGSTKMVVRGDGKVGIGTTSPDKMLHVSSDDNVLATFESTDSHATVRLIDSDTTNQVTFTRVGDDLEIVKDGGNVGIGKDNPAQALDVNGSIISSDVLLAPTYATFIHSFTDDMGTTAHYLPWQSSAETTGNDFSATSFVVPMDMKLVKLFIRIESITNPNNHNLTVTLISKADGSINNTTVASATKAFNINTSNKTATYQESDFNTTPRLTQNQMGSIKVQFASDIGASTDFFVTSVWEMDNNTL